MHRRLVDESSDRSQAKFVGTRYTIWMHTRCISASTALPQASARRSVSASVTHLQLSIERKSAHVWCFITAVATPNKAVLSDTAAILPPFDSTAMQAYYARISSLTASEVKLRHAFSDYVNIIPPNRLTWPCVIGMNQM